MRPEPTAPFATATRGATASPAGVGRSGAPSRWTLPLVALGISVVTVPLVAALAVKVDLTSWTWLVILGLGASCVNVGLVLAPLHFRLARMTATLNAYQAREAKLAEERERLLHQTLIASDRERQRLASDLHDGVIQLVSAVTLRSATLSRGLRREGRSPNERLADAAASLDRITIDLQAVTVDLRTLMGALAGAEIQSNGLSGALSALVMPLAESGVHVDVSVGELECDAQVRSLVHRLAQELVRNCAKHAAAHRLSISVGQGSEGVWLRVKDDGRGFNAESLGEMRDRGHLGLSLLDQRVHAAGGTLHLESAPGRGTLVEVILPAASVEPEDLVVSEPLDRGVSAA